VCGCVAVVGILLQLRHPTEPITTTQQCYSYLIGHIDAEDVLHEYLDQYDSAQGLLTVDPEVCTHCPNPHELLSFVQGTAFIFVHMYLQRMVRETVFPGSFYRNAPNQVLSLPRLREGIIPLFLRSGSSSRTW